MATKTWTNKGHSWTDPGAFAPDAPGPNDTALFTGPAGDAAVAGNTTVGALIVSGDARPVFTGLVGLTQRQSMVIDGNGGASFTQGGLFDGGEVVVGQTGAGTLTIGPPNFALSDSSGTAVIGQAAGSSGEVDIAGARAAWLVNSFMWIGNNGFAAVNISAGAVLGIGLRPFNGDNPNADLVIGRHASGVGDVAITGTGSGINDHGTAHVGEAGTALVEISGGFFFAATLDLGATGHITVADGFVSANAGTLAAGSTVSGNGELDLFGVDNEGTITAQGTLELVGTISGAGTLAIAADGTLLLQHGVLGLQTVAFVGPHATLDAGGSVTGTIAGFDTSDALVVTGATALSYAASTGTLSVTIGDSATEQFHFSGLPGGVAFHLVGADKGLIQLVSGHG